MKSQGEGTEVSALGRIVETVSASVITYIAISLIGNDERLQALEGALAQAAATWGGPLLIACVIGVMLGIGAFVASSLVPVQGGVGSGFDPLEPTFLLGRLGRFFLGVALVSGLTSGALYLVHGGEAWGLALLAAGALIVVRWVWITGRRWRRFWRQGII